MSFEVGDLVMYHTIFPARVIATPNVPGPTFKNRNEHAKIYPKYGNVKNAAGGSTYVIEFTTKKTPQQANVMHGVTIYDIKKQSGGGKSKKTRKARKQRKGTYRKRR